MFVDFQYGIDHGTTAIRNGPIYSVKKSLGKSFSKIRVLIVVRSDGIYNVILYI